MYAILNPYASTKVSFSFALLKLIFWIPPLKTVEVLCSDLIKKKKKLLKLLLRKTLYFFFLFGKYFLFHFVYYYSFYSPLTVFLIYIFAWVLLLYLDITKDWLKAKNQTLVFSTCAWEHICRHIISFLTLWWYSMKQVPFTKNLLSSTLLLYAISFTNSIFVVVLESRFHYVILTGLDLTM